MRSDPVEALRAAGCIAAEEEAHELAAAAGRLGRPLAELVRRRVEGEPLAWVTGRIRFAGFELEMRPGVFVPRPHSEWLAERAGELLGGGGILADLCTGCGAVAAAASRLAPFAEIWGTDLDPAAVDLARVNGVHALRGDLDAPLRRSLHARCTVVTCVPPYVPEGELAMLPRDAREREPLTALLDADLDGLGTARRAVTAAAGLLVHGGTLLIEAGDSQCEVLAGFALDAGYAEAALHHDPDGQARGVLVSTANTAC
jgi:release factor glutamine methyltransferase